ncbi:UPF0149 family protein [Vibrio sp.]|nr:UPF0149 family protein [Vibrio sp.]
MTLKELLAQPELKERLLSEAQIHGFITSMAAAPHIISPEEWLPYLWGGEETAPFTDMSQLELFADKVVEYWNEARPALLDGEWKWPAYCQLDDEEIITAETREFCEGLLQGWQLARDDWETIMPQHSEDNALLGGVLLSISMLYDPETSMATLSEQGMSGLDQFKEIFDSMPMMLSGLTIRAAIHIENAEA